MITRNEALTRLHAASQFYAECGEVLSNVIEMNDAMESVLAKIGNHLGVEPGDVDALLAAVEKV